MLLIRKPSDAFIQRFLEEQSRLGFSYDAVGATFGEVPPGFDVDRTRIRLGEGEAAFQAAKVALARWDQFRLGWVGTRPEGVPIERGAVVAVLARAINLWWLNACRIVDTVDESGEFFRFGFAYGTLPEHAEMGEERFLIEWNRADDSVWFDILAFSRPKHPLVRLGYPVVRRTQKRFGREACAAMLRSVRRIGPPASLSSEA
ncbi:DUF1990 family protein [bacterium]|nr:DUF1990 family protein [bacterium]